ncbi:MAG: M24 family metallopeptidase C-terminal domain-containing protein, partial [Pseudomonadota bacterium]
ASVSVSKPSIARSPPSGTLGSVTAMRFSIDRRLIDRDLLERGEIAWLNAYHARVLAEIGPLVAEDPDTAHWLRDACAPLS